MVGLTEKRTCWVRKLSSGMSYSAAGRELNIMN